MRIAIDFDGVIANTLKQKSIWLLKNKGLHVEPELTVKSEFIARFDHSLYKEMQANVGYEDTLDALPVDGCLGALSSIAINNHVYVLTSRPEEKLHWVEKWLSKYGFENLIEDIYSTHLMSKLKQASKLSCSALIDNDLRHLMDGHYSGVKKVLFSDVTKRGLSSHLPSDMVVAKSWQEILELIGVTRSKES
jgi:hypothetical protein